MIADVTLVAIALLALAVAWHAGYTMGVTRGRRRWWHDVGYKRTRTEIAVHQSEAAMYRRAWQAAEERANRLADALEDERAKRGGPYR